MREAWRRYWPVDVLGLILVVVVVAFAYYAEHRQHVADLREQQTRQSLCAILDRIPEGIDSGMDQARALDQCGRPHPPSVFFGRPFPKPAPTVTVQPAPPAIVVVTPSGGTVSPQPSPTASGTPQPSPTPTSTATPRPTPTPSPTCVLILCIH